MNKRYRSLPNAELMVVRVGTVQHLLHQFVFAYVSRIPECNDAVGYYLFGRDSLQRRSADVPYGSRMVVHAKSAIIAYEELPNKPTGDHSWRLERGM